MPFVSAKLTGIAAAVEDLRTLPGELQSAAADGLNATAAAVRARAIKLTTDRYNIEPDILSDYVELTVATPSAVQARVKLLARPLPVSTFNPRVKMIQARVKARNGRVFTRALPSIEVKRLRKGGHKKLGKYFPLYQRSNGGTTDPIARRVDARQYALTGAWFYTFPKRFLAELEAQLQPYADEKARVEVTGAIRVRARSLRALKLQG